MPVVASPFFSEECNSGVYERRPLQCGGAANRLLPRCEGHVWGLFFVCAEMAKFKTYTELSRWREQNDPTVIARAT